MALKYLTRWIIKCDFPDCEAEEEIEINAIGLSYHGMIRKAERVATWEGRWVKKGQYFYCEEHAGVPIDFKR